MALIPAAERPGPLVPVNFHRRWDRFRRAAGFKVKAKDLRGRPWPHDAMRHTYAFHQNEYLLQAQMGHTNGQMIFKRYRAAATRLADRASQRKLIRALVPDGVAQIACLHLQSP